MSKEKPTWRELVEEAHLRILLAYQLPQLNGSEKFRAEVHNCMGQAIIWCQENGEK